MLNGGPWGRMIVEAAVKQFETASQRPAEACGVMTNDRQAAATLGTIHRERADDDMAARIDGLLKPLDISGLIGRCGEEMEGGAVMPDIEKLCRAPFCDIRRDPPRPRRLVAEPGPGSVKRRFRQIQYGHVDETTVDQRINEMGGSAADIHDGGGRRRPGKVDTFERV